MTVPQHQQFKRQAIGFGMGATLCLLAAVAFFIIFIAQLAEYGDVGFTLWLSIVWFALFSVFFSISMQRYYLYRTTIMRNPSLNLQTIVIETQAVPPQPQMNDSIFYSQAQHAPGAFKLATSPELQSPLEEVSLYRPEEVVMNQPYQPVVKTENRKVQPMSYDQKM
ncbi:phosphoadenosine phosphosulfate reductase [Acrasis kona]|uniref:Phosphoadenosine phosphosulfate reductase n=1 Tax=Acrasis kona TaxID=1008807 RepID=A0AAW2ZBM7_9EUKA